MKESRNRQSAVKSDEAGTILVLGLLMMFIGSVLAFSLLTVTETEIQVSNRFDDNNMALMAAEAGLQEALWRLRIKDDVTVAPLAGSLVTGFGIPESVVDAGKGFYRLKKDSAYINPDPHELTNVLHAIPSTKRDGGDEVDSDGDNGTPEYLDHIGFPDEVDELDLWRDWQVQIVYGQYDATKNPIANWDNAPLDATKRGDRLVLPSVIDRSNFDAYSDNKEIYYTTEDEDSPDVLTMRFLREDPDFRDFCKANGCFNTTITDKADIDGDGINEMVFYDFSYIERGGNNFDDDNSISGRSDGVIDNESPYTLDFNDTLDKPATGYPVIVIESTGRVQMGGKDVAKRKIQARISWFRRATNTTAICTCEDITIGGNITVNAYDSTDPLCTYDHSTFVVAYPWDASCPINDPTNLVADIGTNGTLTVNGNSGIYNGSLIGVVEIVGLKGTINGGDVWSKGDIDCSGATFKEPDPRIDEPCHPNVVDQFDICTCKDTRELVASAKLVNDNDDIVYYDSWDAATETDKCNGAVKYCSTCGTGKTLTDFFGSDTDITALNGTFFFPEGGDYYFDNFSVSNNGNKNPTKSSAHVVSGGSGVNINCETSTAPNAYKVINIHVDTTFGVIDKNDDYFVFEKLRPAEYVVWFGDSAGPTDFTFGSSLYTLNMVAPHSNINFNGNAEIAGAITAGDISGGLNGSSTFYYDTTLKEAILGTYRPKIIEWRELP